MTQKDKVIEHDQITIEGTSNLPGSMPVHASELYSKNVAAFLTYMVKDGQLNLDLEDEIISGAMYSHKGQITHEPTKTLMDKEG